MGAETPETYRRNYGLPLFAAGYDGAMDYAYQAGYNNAWNDFDSTTGIYREHVFAYPTTNGVIDTIEWEGYREAVDDMRYLSTLISLDRSRTKEEIRTWLSSVLASNQDLSVVREIVIQQILALSSDSGGSFDFSLAASGGITTGQGNSGQTTIIATLSGGAPVPLTFFASGLPAGATASFSPVSCSPNCSSTLTMNTSASTPIGASTITITATGRGTTKTTSITLTVSDTTAPTITFGSDSVTQTSAIITWTTNEASTNQVEYGFTSSYGASSPLTTSFNTSHSIILSNLSASTTYHYRIHVYDSAGNESISIDRAFMTLPSITPDITPPSAITNLNASQISQTSADFTWTAPGDNDTQGTAISYDLRYSTTTITTNTFTSATRATGVSVPRLAGTQEGYVLIGLTPATTYFVAIRTTDAAGNISPLSNIATFTTLTVIQTPPPPVPPPSGGGGGGGGGGGMLIDTTPPSIPTNATSTSLDSQALLRWKNPTDTDFVRVEVVRKISAPPMSRLDGTLIYEGDKEEFLDTDLTNNTPYYYAIFAYDKKPNYSSPALINAQPRAGVESINILAPKPAQLAQPVQPIPSRVVTIPGITITRWLTVGARGNDVKILQKHLNRIGYLITQTGDGSLGQESDYFGLLTEAALKRFQCKRMNVCSGSHTSTGYGAVGPRTRRVLAESIIAGEEVVVPERIITTIVPSLPTQLTILSLIGPFSIGIRSAQVTILQTLLAKDQSIYPEGLVTGFYGSLTVRAVQRFQERYGIATSGTPETTGYGVAGPKTREKIRMILGE